MMTLVIVNSSLVSIASAYVRNYNNNKNEFKLTSMSESNLSMSEDFKATVQKYSKWESLIILALLSQ
jgi:hypothetical protein